MVKERISSDTKARSGKMLGRAVSAAKAMATKASELVTKNTRTKSTPKATTKSANKTAAKPTSASIKNHGDQLASAVNAVTKPVRKNGSQAAEPAKGMKTQSTAAKARTTKASAKTAVQPSPKTAAKSAKPTAKTASKPAPGTSTRTSKPSGKGKLDSVNAAAGGTGIGKSNKSAASNNSKPAAKTAKQPRKTAGAAPVKDMPAEAPKGSTLPRSRAMPRSGRGASGGTPEPSIRTR